MSGLYIHIPFCKQKCIYCDFFSVVNKSIQDSYIDALICEFALRADEISLNNIDTIYIGGGTPSSISQYNLERLVSSILKKIDIKGISEFTIEVNPDDISFDYANFLFSLNINRVSMGIQSFNDKELIIINRRHNSKKAIDAYKTLREVGFNNISIDLIYGLPEQTINSWEETVETLINLVPEHISCYGLMYEEGTRLYKMRKNGEIKECDENSYINMYQYLIKELYKNGYEHYEISNFAKPDKYSKHNSSYWKNVPYLGLGAGAHSFDGAIRRCNPNNLKEYIDKIGCSKVAFIEEEETVYEVYNDYIMTSMRTQWGLKISDLKLKFGDKLFSHFVDNIKQFIDNGDVIKKGNCIIITESGFLKSDTIFRELFYVE